MLGIFIYYIYYNIQYIYKYYNIYNQWYIVLLKYERKMKIQDRLKYYYSDPEDITGESTDRYSVL